MDFENRPLNVAQTHNQQNPYTDISPYLMRFGFPIVNYPNFMLSGNELFLYAVPAELYNAARKIDQADFKDGDLIITNQRIAFIVENISFQCPIVDVEACEIVNDEVVLIETKTFSYTFMINHELIPYVQKMVLLAKSPGIIEKGLFELV